MKEIDLDATLQLVNNEPIAIKLVDKILFPDEAPILKVQITWQEYQKALQQKTDIFVKSKIERQQQEEEENEVHVTRDFFQVGLCLTQYVVGWEGIVGEFNRTKLYQWFEKAVPDACIAFARGLDKILTDRQKNLLQYRESTKKNS